VKKKVLIVNVQRALQTNLAFNSGMVGFILYWWIFCS